jgi:ubiquinone biosynthesis monooxygenase Coq7
MRTLSPIELAIAAAARGLATLSGEATALRPRPEAKSPDVNQTPLSQQRSPQLSPQAAVESAALMRVNHVGEICAQALYEAQALGARDPRLKEAFLVAAREEVDHLAWTRTRIEELGGRPSLLNPLWYAGSFGIGLLASLAGDRASLGFMAETERQVEEHLNGHLDRLPQEDVTSRAIVQEMRDDEARHAHTAVELGGAEMPFPLRLAMRLAARVMTLTAQRI